MRVETALLATLLAVTVAVSGYLARRIDRLAERIDRVEIRASERHEAILAVLAAHGERLARLEGHLEARAAAPTGT